MRKADKEKTKVLNRINYQKNKEKISISRKINYQKNKKVINAKAREKNKCECGGFFIYAGTARHNKTKKHKKYTDSLI